MVSNFTCNIYIVTCSSITIFIFLNVNINEKSHLKTNFTIKELDYNTFLSKGNYWIHSNQTYLFNNLRRIYVMNK